MTTITFILVDIVKPRLDMKHSFGVIFYETTLRDDSEALTFNLTARMIFTDCIRAAEILDF